MAASLLACALFPLSALPSGRAATATALAGQRLAEFVQTQAAGMFAATSTRAAAQATALALLPTFTAAASSTPAATATPPPPPTFTPPPSDTPAPPTLTPLPTASATPTKALAAGPIILVQVDANCRAGPGISYAVVGYLSAGDTSRVYGSDTYRNWWYIADPTYPGRFCWVANPPTIVKGDTYNVPVIADAELQELTYESEPNPYWCDPFSLADLACCQGSAECYAGQVSELDCALWGDCMPATGSLYFLKFGCPAVTCINQHNYCRNYPRCCGVSP
jgi:hypothetical protein